MKALIATALLAASLQASMRELAAWCFTLCF